MDKVVGVLGGMGPQATVDFFQKVINLTPAGCDQDHIRLLINNDPKTPDRTSFIMGQGESPLNVLITNAIKLQMMGADLLAMPCNTAHFFYDDIVKFVNIPFINMIEEVAKEIKNKFGNGAKAGLLATLGTYKAMVYERVFEKHGIEIIVPDESGKKDVYQLIYKIKENLAKADTKPVAQVIADLKLKGASTVILGCTELPLVEKDLPKDIEYMDSTLILARKAVQMAKGQ
jgi:aspartate racemase